ncbi:MAG: glycosyltransferase family 2 protein [Nitrospirota bacterium]|nr:glycosyltransferase family 2 protein [Nitrospirota bacterium]
MENPESPEVSVVIPCYRGGEHLAEGIESVLAQTFRNFEIVLVDNNVDPETKVVMERYRNSSPERIRIARETGQGACSARNRGILESRGEYISLLDEDDCMIPEKLERQRKMALENPKASMIVSEYTPINKSSSEKIENYTIGGENSRKSLEKHLRNIIRESLPERDPESFMLPLPSTMFFRKKTAIQSGLFDLRLNPTVGEDEVFNFQMFLEGDIVRISDPLSLYRIGGASDVSRFRNNPILFLKKSNRTFFIIWETLEKRGISWAKPFRKLASFHLRTYGKSLIRFQGGPSIARILFFRAWKNSPTDFDLLKCFAKSCFPEKLLPRLFWFDQFFPESISENISHDKAKELFNIPPKWID